MIIAANTQKQHTKSVRDISRGSSVPPTNTLESFAHQHGRLTYYELTMKERHRDVGFEFDDEGYVIGNDNNIAKVENLTVGSFRREYSIVRKIPENVTTTFPQRYQWCIQQYNQTPSEEEKAAHPEHPGAYFATCDCGLDDVSPFGLYNPRHFGLNLERRLSGLEILDAQIVEFSHGVFSQLRNYAEARGLPKPKGARVGGDMIIIGATQKSPLRPGDQIPPYINSFFTGPEELHSLWRTPLLLGKEDYLDLMAIHGWATSGNDDIYKQNLGKAFYLHFHKHREELREHADRVPLDKRTESLQKAYEHLKGFSIAASGLEDVTTHEKAERLARAFEKEIR